jgi:hypothetical protein
VLLLLLGLFRCRSSRRSFDLCLRFDHEIILIRSDIRWIDRSRRSIVVIEFPPLFTLIVRTVIGPMLYTSADFARATFDVNAFGVGWAKG